MAEKLPRSWYARPAPDLARSLLGTILVRREGAAELRGRIVETEAYTGEQDPGSHAYRGPTRRTQVMFGAAGHLYVYLTYGMHHCMNVVSDGVGVAGAVLLRAAEPLAGIEFMQVRRGGRTGTDLCNGPAKLCQAFGITRSQNGVDLLGDEIWIECPSLSTVEIAVSTRVGLTAGKELPLRFYFPGNPYVSRGRPSAPLPVE